MKVIVTKNYEEMSEKAFEIMREVVTKNPSAVLGLATGSTPVGLYKKMIADHKENGTSYKKIHTVNLDEYARAYNDKAVKKTLSIPAWLNTACENYGINYSKVLQDALIAKIQARS